jgi:hypothetical protein
MKRLWIILALVPLPLAGCQASPHDHHGHHVTMSTHPPAAPSPPPDPAVQAQMEAAAGGYLGLLSAGDWTAAWNMWTSSARSRIPQRAFVRQSTACATPAAAKPYQIIAVQTISTGIARAVWVHGEQSGDLILRREEATWSVEPFAKDAAGGCIADDTRTPR